MSFQFCGQPVFKRVHKASVIAIFGVALSACQTSAGATWPALGTYRLPYADGTDIKVWQDFTTHTPIGRYDLKGQGGGPYSIVASAPGWVRIISDQNVGGDEVPNNFVWIEHPYPFCQPDGVTWPGKPADYDDTCIQCLGDFCNEWTKYSHLQTDSASGDAGLVVGEFVEAGDLVGYEGSVGARSQHLHWEVARLDPDDVLANDAGDAANGLPHDWSDDGWVGSPDLLPRLCGVAGYLEQNEFYTAEACPDNSHAPNSGGNVAADVRWTWQGRTVSSTALVKFSAPDQRNRITVSSFDLDRPVTLDGTGAVLQRARLIRPITFALARDGTARTPGDAVVFTFTVSNPLAPSIVKSDASGPLRAGYLNLRYLNGTLQFSLDAAPFGTVVGATRVR